MPSTVAKKKIIKRELAELKLALAKKRQKLERKKIENRADLEDARIKMQSRLREQEAVAQAKTRKLETKISELEEKITAEKKQLFKVIAIEQHEAIDHLETYLEEVDHKYANLRGFWKTIKKEFRDMIRNNRKLRK